MNPNSHHCNDDRLENLVFGDEDTDEYRIAAEHVETCEQCQERLSQLTGSEEALREVGGLLSGYPTDHWSPHYGFHEPVRDIPTQQLDFLEPPSHPEMLGRLGRYEIERVIGAGGMGIVLKAFDTELNRPVAIKILARHLAHSGAARQRFTRESRAAAAVVHEHVVAIHNVETDHKTPFLVMQFVAGESLQTRVDRDGPLDPKEVLRIGIQAAAGLSAAHEQGVVHRDVKPANILLEHGVERALLTDFGLARTVDDASLTNTGIVAGTPHYMSPEQANGAPTDHRTDLFSLGSVLYFMVTGRPPFRAERAMGILHRICHDRHRPVWQVNPDVPDPLSDIIDKLLEKKVNKRFADAAAVKQALAETLAAIQQRPPRRNRLRRLISKYPRTAVAVPILLLLAISMTLITSWLQNGSPATTKRTEPEMPSPSIEVIQQASVQEGDRYVQMIHGIDQSLAELESLDRDSSFGFPMRSEWDVEVDTIHAQLDRIESDPKFQ